MNIIQKKESNRTVIDDFKEWEKHYALEMINNYELLI